MFFFCFFFKNSTSKPFRYLNPCYFRLCNCLGILNLTNYSSWFFLSVNLNIFFVCHNWCSEPSPLPWSGSFFCVVETMIRVCGADRWLGLTDHRQPRIVKNTVLGAKKINSSFIRSGRVFLVGNVYPYCFLTENAPLSCSLKISPTQSLKYLVNADYREAF